MTYQKNFNSLLRLLVISIISSFVLVSSVYADSNATNFTNNRKGTIVVANRASGNLSLINVSTDIATTLNMPSDVNKSEPMYIVYKRGRVFVGDRANNRIVVFNSRNWNVIAEIPAGNGVFHMWAQHKGKQLWVNNTIDKTITVINTKNLTVINTINLPADLVADGAAPHDVILDRRSAYVTMTGLSGDTDVVVKYSLRNFRERARADVGKDPHVTLSPNRRTLFVGSQNNDEVRVLRRKNLKEITTIRDIPNAHGIDITRNGKIVYTTNIGDGGSNALYTINARTKMLVGNPVDTAHPIPHNIVLTRPNNKLYVTHSGPTSDKVSVFTISKQDPEPVYLTDVTTGLNPFGIEFVPKKRKKHRRPFWKLHHYFWR